MAAARRAPPNRGRTGASSSAAHTPRGRQGRSPIFRHAARRRMEVDPHLPGAAYAARPLHQRRFGEQSLARLTGPDSAPFSLRGRPACARASTGRSESIESSGFGAAHVTLLASILRACRVRSCTQEPPDGRISFASVRAGRDSKYKAAETRCQSSGLSLSLKPRATREACFVCGSTTRS
jgi:hypothetical protein